MCTVGRIITNLLQKSSQVNFFQLVRDVTCKRVSLKCGQQHLSKESVDRGANFIAGRMVQAAQKVEKIWFICQHYIIYNEDKPSMRKAKLCVWREGERRRGEEKGYQRLVTAAALTTSKILGAHVGQSITEGHCWTPGGRTAWMGMQVQRTIANVRVSVYKTERQHI